MYAIVNILGKQFKVKKDQQIFVNRLPLKEGSNVNFDNVLLLDNGKKINIGSPKIEGAVVTAKILEHLKGDKVIVFKKKRRKGYKVKNGHRDHLTKIEILTINEKGGTRKKVKKEDIVKISEKTASKKTVAKKTTAKKTTAKKTTAKKTTAKE